jgi:hypothetical protein
MASTIKEVVTVASLGKWGPRVGDEYYSWSKNIKEADKGRVVPGGTYEMDLYIADSGKRYINAVTVGPNLTVGVAAVPAIVAPVFKDTPIVKPMKAKDSEPMSKAEWSAKDRSQLIGGLSHDAAAITAAFAPLSVDIDTPGALKLYKELLLGMLAIRDEMK